MENQKKIDHDSNELTIREIILGIRSLWRYLLSKWVIILVVGLLGGTLGLIYALLSKPVYKAELTFAVQDEKPGAGVSSAAGLASQFGIDLGSGAGGEFSGDNLIELMKSRSIIERTLLMPVTINGKNETLAEFYISFNNLRAGWSKDPSLLNMHFLPAADRAKFSLKQDSILSAVHESIIKGALNVSKVDKKLSIITVVVKSKSELFAKYFTDMLVKVTSDFYVQTKTEKASRNVAILQRQTDSVRRALNSAISGVAASADINPNPNPSRQMLRVPSQRRQVDVQANTIILSELVKNLEIAKMSLLQQTPLIQVIDHPIFPLDKEKLGKSIGIIVGGLISGFLIVLILLVIKFYKSIMVDN